MRTRVFQVIAIGGALVLPAVLMWSEAVLEPPSGVWRAVFWPVDLLLWASGPGAPLSNGRFEWTPVQDLATAIGVGLSWPFWLSVVRVGLRFARRARSR